MKGQLHQSGLGLYQIDSQNTRAVKPVQLFDNQNFVILKNKGNVNMLSLGCYGRLGYKKCDKNAQTSDSSAFITMFNAQ